MPRKAASPEEIDQVGRVHGLLIDAGVVPTRELIVTLASGNKITGWLIKNFVGNKQERRDRLRTYFGVLTLATEGGDVDIDYLDIVWLQRVEERRDDLLRDASRRQEPEGSPLSNIRAVASTRPGRLRLARS